MLKCNLKRRQQNAFFIIFVFFTFWKIPKLKDQLSLLSFEWKKNLKSSRIYRTWFRLIELILLLKLHDSDKLLCFILFFVIFFFKRNITIEISWSFLAESIGQVEWMADHLWEVEHSAPEREKSTPSVVAWFLWAWVLAALTS